ncbi:hypothetical protein [Pontibacillus yanchengensis]|nr:hypothetical protein [Pontibacillus yanchengensis]
MTTDNKKNEHNQRFRREGKRPNFLQDEVEVQGVLPGESAEKKK